ncbi:MAG: geranylgeranyl pyrophosphate synthase [Egibacteraceae bacterium]
MLAARLGLFRGGDGEGYYSDLMALPVLEFPQWAAAHAARQGTAIAPPVLANLVEAAAVGYLHIRVQDDWFDEAIGAPGTVMMLSDMLFTRAQALLAREVSQSAFWELFEEVQLGYAEAMLFERRMQRGEEPYEAVAFQKVLARSRPLVLPPAAVFFLADLAESVETLERFSAALVTGHQLLADLLDAEKDWGNENMTHVLWRLGGRPGGKREADALRVALFSWGGFDAVISDALEEVARARQVADVLAMPEAARFCEERMRFTTELHARVLRAFFAGALALEQVS